MPLQAPRRNFFITDDSESFDSGESDIESSDEIDQKDKRHANFGAHFNPTANDDFNFKGNTNSNTTANPNLNPIPNAIINTNGHPNHANPNLHTTRLTNPLSLVNPANSAQFGKVLVQPEDETTTKKSSNLSNLLRAPARGTNSGNHHHSSMRLQQQKFNLGANHFFKPLGGTAACGVDDLMMMAPAQQPFSTNINGNLNLPNLNPPNLNTNINDNVNNVNTPFCESESLRRGLQLDRKPLFDFSLGYGNSTGESFSTTPSAW